MSQKRSSLPCLTPHFFLVVIICSTAPHHTTVSTMSEGAPPAEPPTKQMAEVRLDADGKPLSKNALKKLLKAEKAAKAKAEKEAKRVRPVIQNMC